MFALIACLLLCFAWVVGFGFHTLHPSPFLKQAAAHIKGEEQGRPKGEPGHTCQKAPLAHTPRPHLHERPQKGFSLSFTVGTLLFF